MPKLKSHKASLRRFKVSATGKVFARPIGGRHMMSGKSAKKRRHMRRARPLKTMDRTRTMRALNRSPILKKAQPGASAAQTSKPEGA